MARPFRVLLLDDMNEGGLEQAERLASLAGRLGDDPEKAFDLIVGSGTGALLAAMFGLLQVRSKDLVRRYRKAWQGLHVKHGWIVGLLASTTYSETGAEEALLRLTGKLDPTFRNFRDSSPVVALLGSALGKCRTREKVCCFSNCRELMDFHMSQTLSESLRGLLVRLGELPPKSFRTQRKDKWIRVGPTSVLTQLGKLCLYLDRVPTLVVVIGNSLGPSAVKDITSLNERVEIAELSGADIDQNLLRQLRSVPAVEFCDETKCESEEESQSRKPAAAQQAISVPVEEKEPVVDTDALTPEQRKQLCDCCCERYIKTVFPCGHAIYCLTCARAYVAAKCEKKCPICREPFEKISRLYLG